MGFYYPIEDQVNACFKFLGKQRKDAHKMCDAELCDAEAELIEDFEWVAHDDYIQAIPKHRKSGTLIFAE